MSGHHPGRPRSVTEGLAKATRLPSPRQGTLETVDGRQLQLRQWPLEEPDDVLVVVHGLGEHSGRYRRLAEFLQQRRCAVVAMDLHGHGRSPGRRGDAPSFETLVGDIASLVAETRCRWPRTEPTLLGHSFGGNLVLHYLLDPPHRLGASPCSGDLPRRAVLSNPIILPADPPTRPQTFAAWITGKLLPHVRLSASIDEEALTRDEAIQQEQRDDPLIHDKLSIGIGSQLVSRGRWLVEHADRLSTETLMLTGGADELGDEDSRREFLRRAGPLCRRHQFEGFRHQLFHEVGRESVFRFLLHWLQSGRGANAVEPKRST